MKIFDKEKFPEEKILDFLNSKLNCKIDSNDLRSIIELLKNVSRLQNISINEIEYKGTGQAYTVLTLGNCAIKIGPEINMIRNPYQMLPYNEINLEESNQKVYLAPKCDTENISREDVQKMYNMIRDDGGIWLDPGTKNLGLAKKSNMEKLTRENITFYGIDREFATNDSELYITDLEDVVFLTSKLIQDNMDVSKRWVTLPYGNLEGGILGNRIFLDSVVNVEDIEEIYEKCFIMRSQTLLEYEEAYQREKGNKQLETKYKSKRIEILKEIEKSRYIEEQYYKFGRNPSKVKNKWNITEIAHRVLQQTRLSRVKEMVYSIKQRMIKDRQVYQQDDKKNSDTKIQLTDVKKEESDPFRTLDIN